MFGQKSKMGAFITRSWLEKQHNILKNQMTVELLKILITITMVWNYFLISKLNIKRSSTWLLQTDM